MKKRNIAICSVLASTLLILSSCKKNLPDIGGTAAQKMANEWWVTLKLNGVDQYGTHVKIETYNTAANDNNIWIDDFPNAATSSGNVWGFKVKAAANFDNLTFNANQVVSSVPGYGIKVNITNGQVFSGGGRSKTGNVTDSIYMKIQFEDDPGHTYELSGHGRTAFVEDEY